MCVLLCNSGTTLDTKTKLCAAPLLSQRPVTSHYMYRTAIAASFSVMGSGAPLQLETVPTDGPRPHNVQHPSPPHLCTARRRHNRYRGAATASRGPTASRCRTKERALRPQHFEPVGPLRGHPLQLARCATGTNSYAQSCPAPTYCKRCESTLKRWIEHLCLHSAQRKG